MITKSLQVSGNSTVKTLSIDTSKAKWMWYKAPSTNSHPVLVGGAEVSASPVAGFPLNPGDPAIFIPNVSDMFEFYQFKLCYAYVATGDVLNVLYGVEGSNS